MGCASLLLVVALTYAVAPLRRVFGLAEPMFVFHITAWLLIVAGGLTTRAFDIL